MMRYSVIFLIAGIILITPNQSFSLSCALPPFDEEYKKHDLLLYGKLIERSSPLSMTKITTLVFETITVYKGEYQDKFTVKADLTWDDHYREGEQYILFADKRGDHYYRDLCVGDYIATDDIVKFLDNYTQGKATGNDVFSLYDIVSYFEMKQLESKMDLYSRINSGNDLLRNLLNEKPIHDYSCNFETDLQEAEKLFEDSVYVFNKLREHSSNYTVTTDSTLSTNPQTSIMVIESPKHKAIINILNSPHFENCFFVYNQQLIDKTTGELDVNRDNLERLCSADNATAILPDLCKGKSITGNIDIESIDLEGMLYVVILLVLFGVIAFGLIMYKKKQNTKP